VGCCLAQKIFIERLCRPARRGLLDVAGIPSIRF
jgi:hypothetical protein